MTAAVRELMSSFEALSAAEKQEAAAEILRRVPFGCENLSDECLTELADGLFQALDAEEEEPGGQP